MFHKISKVIPKENLIIEVEFENKIRKTYDIKKTIEKWKVFKDLEDENLFKLVKVDIGGYGISWNESIDLSCEEIWEKGEIV